MKYAIEQRLRLIDFLLLHFGEVGREHLMDYFGLERLTATADFKRYQELAPGNMEYNPRVRRYVRTASFKRYYE